MAIIIGAGCYYLSSLSILEHLPISLHTIYIIFAALAVGLSIFAMVVTDTEHGPAAGMALGLVLNSWDYKTLIFVLSAVATLALIRYLFRKRMIDLT